MKKTFACGLVIGLLLGALVFFGIDRLLPMRTYGKVLMDTASHNSPGGFYLDGPIYLESRSIDFSGYQGQAIAVSGSLSFIKSPSGNRFPKIRVHKIIPRAEYLK